MLKNKKINILIVEDEVPLLNAIKIKLEKSGFLTVTARTYDHAIKLLDDKVDINVIWLDHYLLGSKNGLDFISTIKNNKKYRHIPVFLVSNTATQDKIKSYVALGVKEYYTKSNHRLDDIIADISKNLRIK